MTAAGVVSDDNRSPSDRELVAALGDGDLAALDVLYSRHASLAYGFALRVTGGQGQAEDAVHAAFMRLWSDRAERDTETEPVRVRLVRLVARAAMDNIRVQRPRSSRSVTLRPGRARPNPLAGLPQDS